MRPSPDEIRKRIAKRKKKRERSAIDKAGPVSYTVQDEEKYGFEKMLHYEGEPPEKGGHPLFNKEWFFLKVMISASLVLSIAILFRADSEYVRPVKQFIVHSMEQDFQFAAVAKWYEEQFGNPLALLPGRDSGNEKQISEPEEYALPASGKILEEFDSNGQRIAIETEPSAHVTAMNEGWVRFIGTKEGFGKTVIIQHGDKSETWYGNLSSIDVSLYEFVEKGSNLGKTSDGGDGLKGMFYFAIKKGDDFIDPIQVIQFE